MVFSVTFNKVSVISWRPVLLLGETGVSGETTDLSLVTDKLYPIKLYRVIGTDNDCIGSCKSKYHTITTTTVLKEI